MCRTCCCSCSGARPCCVPYRPRHRPDHPCDPYLPLTLCEPSVMNECCMPPKGCCYPKPVQRNPPCRYSAPCKAHCYDTPPCVRRRRRC